MNRRRFLLLAGVSALSLTIPALSMAAQEPLALATDRDLVDDAIAVVTDLWDVPPVQAEAFGFPMWTTWSSEKVRDLVHEATLKEHDPIMWQRVLLWIQIGYALDRKFGKNNGEKHYWMNNCEPLVTYNVKFYVLSGSPSNLDAALKTMDASWS